MSGWLEALPLSAPAGWLLAFALHATVLLLAVWLIERMGLLKHPGGAEWAWRVALFGAFASMTLELVPWNAMRTPPPPAAATTVSMPIASDAIVVGLALWLQGTLLLLARVLFQAAGLLRLRRRLVREGARARPRARTCSV